MKPHKYAELIKQWADGAKVQFKDVNSNVWVEIYNPEWVSRGEYRIKPAKKVVRWLWAYKHNNCWYLESKYFTEAEFDEIYQDEDDYKKLEWSREEFDE